MLDFNAIGLGTILHSCHWNRSVILSPTCLVPRPHYSTRPKRLSDVVQATISRPFALDTSPKWIDREELGKRRTGTGQVSHQLGLRSFSNDDGDGNDNVKRSNRYISLPLLHDYDEGRKQATTHFFLYLNLNAVPKKSTPGKFAYIWNFQRAGINATNSDKTRIHF